MNKKVTLLSTVFGVKAQRICITEDICLKSQINLLKVKTCITINSCYYLICIVAPCPEVFRHLVCTVMWFQVWYNNINIDLFMHYFEKWPNTLSKSFTPQKDF